jgi:nuclear pore complex protein Nup155
LTKGTDGISLTLCVWLCICRFYEAVVELPLRKAKVLDPNEDAFNEHIDENRRELALLARRQCYEIVGNALRHLKDATTQSNVRSGFVSGQNLITDVALRDKYIRQIIQLSMRCPDQAFHEYLYQTMMEVGLEAELLELGGPDLVPFLQNAGSRQISKVPCMSALNFGGV